MFPVREFNRLSDREFIGLCYNAFLNRHPEDENLHVNYLQEGGPRRKLALSFVESSEYKAINQNHSRDIGAVLSFFLADEYVEDALSVVGRLVAKPKLTAQMWGSLVDIALGDHPSFSDVITVLGGSLLDYTHGFVYSCDFEQISGLLPREGITDEGTLRVFANGRLITERRQSEAIYSSDYNDESKGFLRFRIRIPEDLWSGDVDLVQIELKVGDRNIVPTPIYVISRSMKSMTTEMDRSQSSYYYLFLNPTFR